MTTAQALFFAALAFFAVGSAIAAYALKRMELYWMSAAAFIGWGAFTYTLAADWTGVYRWLSFLFFFFAIPMTFAAVNMGKHESTEDIDPEANDEEWTAYVTQRNRRYELRAERKIRRRSRGEEI